MRALKDHISSCILYKFRFS